MEEFKWETLTELMGGERFALAEVIPVLIDNQEELHISFNDLCHIVAILFKFETDETGKLIFTTFNGLISWRDLKAAYEVIRQYEDPVQIINIKEGLESGGKNLDKAFELGIDIASEEGDSASLIIYERKPQRKFPGLDYIIRTGHIDN